MFVTSGVSDRSIFYKVSYKILKKNVKSIWAVGLLHDVLSHFFKVSVLLQLHF